MDEYFEGLGENQGSILGIDIDSKKFIVEFTGFSFQHEDVKFQEDKQLLLSNNYDISQILGLVNKELASFSNILAYKVRSWFLVLLIIISFQENLDRLLQDWLTDSPGLGLVFALQEELGQW